MKKLLALVAAALMIGGAFAEDDQYLSYNLGTSDDFAFSLVRIATTDKSQGSVLTFGEGTTVGMLDVGSQTSQNYDSPLLMPGELVADLKDLSGKNFFFEFCLADATVDGKYNVQGLSQIVSYNDVMKAISPVSLDGMVPLNMKASAAPEPTSGLLLLVGGALLGLRRKRRVA